jgi:hypothetical protein
VESMAKTQTKKQSKRDGKDVKCAWRTAKTGAGRCNLQPPHRLTSCMVFPKEGLV